MYYIRPVPQCPELRADKKHCRPPQLCGRHLHGINGMPLQLFANRSLRNSKSIIHKLNDFTFNGRVPISDKKVTNVSKSESTFANTPCTENCKPYAHFFGFRFCMATQKSTCVKVQSYASESAGKGRRIGCAFLSRNATQTAHVWRTSEHRIESIPSSSPGSAPSVTITVSSWEKCWASSICFLLCKSAPRLLFGSLNAIQLYCNSIPIH